MMTVDDDTVLAIDLSNARQAFAECEEKLEETVVAWLEAKRRVAELTRRIDETDEA